MKCRSPRVKPWRHRSPKSRECGWCKGLTRKRHITGNWDLLKRLLQASCERHAHQKAFYHISKLWADIQRIPEVNLQPIHRKGAGRLACSRECAVSDV